MSFFRAARRLFHSRGWRVWLRLSAVTALSGVLLTGGLVTPPPAAALGQAPLMPDGGQFVSVAMYKVLDTRTGIGEPSPAPLASGASISVAVTGAGGVPADADAVVANINVLNTTRAGFLSAYDTDSGDPGVASVAVHTGLNTSQTEVIPVSTAGTVSFTNHSPASVDVAVTITGYYTGTGAPAAGSTYTGLPWTRIVDTQAGLGTAQAQIPAGGSITVQAGGQGGIAAGASTAVLQLDEVNATQDGYLTAYAAGSPDPGLAALTYGSASTVYRNLFYTPLSASGQATITNHGPTPIDLTIYTRGYFMPPPTTPAGGEFTPIDPDMLYGTATAGVQLAAGQSVTFQVADNGTSTDQGIIPQDVTQVAEDVIVTSPTASGRVQVNVPGGPVQGVINFLAGDNTNVGYDNSLVTQVSGTGTETVTNNSAGTINLQVAAVGFFEPSSAPLTPTSVAAAVSGTSATVTWAAPDSDGGSPVTGYTITAPPDTASVTVAGTATTATLTGLSHPSTDTFAVTATNAAGTGNAGTYTPQAAVVSGTVLQPSGAPLAGDTVSVYTADPPDPSLTSWTPSLLGTTTTDASGNWSFTVPPYASLPADAQAAAAYDGGELNVQAVANGTAVTGGTTYLEQAMAYEPSWVGTSTPAAAPDGTPTPQTMTLYPQGPDNSAQVTTTSVASTYASLHDSEVTANPADDTTATPTDAYGFQEIGGNGTYSPFIAADGTNLASMPVTPATPQDNPCFPDPEVQIGSRWDKWVNSGEAHTWWDVTGSFKYGRDGKTAVGAVFSLDFGADWTASGSFTFTDSRGTGWSDTLPLGDHDAHRFKLLLWFKKVKTHITCLHGGSRTAYVIREAGLHNPAGTAGPDKFSSYTMTGEDGHQAFLASNPAYRNWIRLGVNRCIQGVYGRYYKAGVTLAGLGVFTETQFNNTTTQCIQAGHKHWRHHWEWGRGGKFTDRLARVLYSY